MNWILFTIELTKIGRIMSSSNSSSTEDLLWKLGISTLFILTHQLLIRNTGTPKDLNHKSIPLQKLEAADSGSTTKASTSTANDLSSIPDDKDHAHVDSLSCISTSELYSSPTAALETILAKASERLYQSPIPVKLLNGKNSPPSSGTSYGSDPKVLYDEIMSHNISNNDPEYIQDTFQQTVRLFYEENQSLKKKIDDLQQQMTISRSGSDGKISLFSPSSLTSTTNTSHLPLNQTNSSLLFTTPFKGPLATSLYDNSSSMSTNRNMMTTTSLELGESPSLQSLIEQNQKLTQDKQLLIQSIELAQHQFLQIHQQSQQKKNNENIKNINGEISFQEGDEDSEHQNQRDYDEHLFLRIQQILQEFPDYPSDPDQPSNTSNNGIQSISSPSFLHNQTSFVTAREDGSGSPVLSSDSYLLQKLSGIKRVVLIDYPQLSKQYQQLSQKYETCQEELRDLKHQLNQYKLLKIQEITDLHRKIVELSQFYEQQLQQQQQQQPSSKSNSRTSTPNRKKAHPTTPIATTTPTPNKHVITLPASIPNISHVNANSMFITKELARSYQQPTQSGLCSRSTSLDDTIVGGGGLGLGEEIHKSHSGSIHTTRLSPLPAGGSYRVNNPLSNPRRFTPSKVRKSSTSPSLSSYRKSQQASADRVHDLSQEHALTPTTTTAIVD